MKTFSTRYRIRFYDANGNIVNWYDFDKNKTPLPITTVLDDPRFVIEEVEVVEPVSVTEVAPKEFMEAEQ